MTRIGFLINPIAGMGGRVGLKGTDSVAAEAVRRGAQPIANGRALEALRELSRLLEGTLQAQGFVLGRGNQPLSPAVIRQIGTETIMLIAPPAKLARTPALRFDTGDPALDAALIARKFLPVMTGYRRTRLVKTAG
jgi:predicted polyphosphate/ATP-dependent NAD kinase